MWNEVPRSIFTLSKLYQSIIFSFLKKTTAVTAFVSKSLFFKACKFDFEDGKVGWEKTGTTFDNQPTYGDNPTAREREPAKQQGDWWIGGYEDRPSKAATPGRIQGDGPRGTLTSPLFKIIGPNITFLIGGGCRMDSIRAELVINDQVE